MGLTAATLLAVLGVAGSAQAAGWNLESSRTLSLRTDGISFAVWDGPRAGQVTIYNTDTGKRRVAALPAGCGLTGGSPDFGLAYDGAAAGRSLLVCGETADSQETAAVYDLRTEALTPLPVGAPAQAEPANNFQYRDIGTHWAKGSREASCAATCTITYSYVNLDTGQQVVSSDDIVDLDETTLPPACGRLHRYTGRRGLLGTDQDSYYSSQKLGERYEVRRVGCTSITTIARERLPAPSFQATGGLVSWTTARDPTNYSGSPAASRRIPAVVALTSTTGGRARRWPAPIHILHTPGDEEQLRGSFGVVAHTHRRLFFLSALRLDTAGVDYVNRAALYSRAVGG